MKLDRLDQAILKLLQSDSRRSFAELAREVNLTGPAVRRRIEKMTKKGVIRRFTLERGDMQARAIVLVSVDSEYETTDISEKLATLEGIQIIYEITGQYDIIAVLSAPDISDINANVDQIRRTAGIIDTNTVIILRHIPHS